MENTRQIAVLEGAFRKASSKFKIFELKAHQKLAIKKVLVEKDVFVKLPTGSGKSLIGSLSKSSTPARV